MDQKRQKHNNWKNPGFTIDEYKHPELLNSG